MALLYLFYLIYSAICMAFIFSKHYKVAGWKACIPFYNSYLQSKYTFGERYGWIGLAFGLIGTFFGYIIASLSILSIVFFIMYAWYTYSVYDRLIESKVWKIVAIFLFVIGLTYITFSKKTHYKGPKEPNLPL